MKSEFVGKLVARAGAYAGTGLNHEGQSFLGTLIVSSIVAGKGVVLQFKAVGENGVTFHEEYTTVAPQLAGEIGLYNLNSNMPGLVLHTLSKCETSGEGVVLAVFSYGAREDRNSFREEVTIELHEDGRIGYRYAWGLPCGDFADRSGVTLQPA